jgi:hypothetical protein
VNGYFPNHINRQDPCVYFSPSIEYSGHPFYARVHDLSSGWYVQMVLMCRVNPAFITVQRQLMANETTEIDPNIPNSGMEFIVSTDANGSVADRVVVYGIMIRVFDESFLEHPSTRFWRDRGLTTIESVLNLANRQPMK